MEYTIVPMDRSHVGQIAELERECFSTPWSEAMLTEALFDAQASFIVAESEDGGLYEKHGFHRAGLRPGYYQKPKEDAVIMTRDFKKLR